MSKYNLNIVERNHRLTNIIGKQYKRIRKTIGRRIFSTLDIWLKEDENRFWYGKKIQEAIFESIDLKIELRTPAFHMNNELIEKEYSHILDLEYKIENLERELYFYNNYFNNQHKIINKQQ